MDAPLVVAQVIETTWGKRARGGGLAVQRSRVPECLPLPTWKQAPESICVVHHVEYDGRNNFAASTVERIVQHVAFPVVLCNCVELHREGPTLHVIFGGDYTLEGQPGTIFGYRRMGSPGRTIPHEPFTLHTGSWGQIRYFGRFALGSDGYIVYKKYAYNIAWRVPPAHQLFLATQPHRRFASLPRLW